MISSLRTLNDKLYDLPSRYFDVGYWLLLVITLYSFVWFRYVPSLDGPQHLHNAYVLKDLIMGRGLVPEFYQINPLPVGYWTSMLFLSLLTVPFPPWLAEKLMLVTLVAGMALSYRYFLRGMGSRVNPLAQYLIFPLIPSFFLLAGYYAFSFGVVFFFLAYGYWFRIGPHPGNRNLVRFALLLLIFYFTHGLVFTFFMATFALHFLVESVRLGQEGNGEDGFSGNLWMRAVRTAAAFVPSLIPLLIYSLSVTAIQSGADGNAASAHELMKMLIRIRPIIGFHHEMESVATRPLFFALLLTGLTLVIDLAIRAEKKKVTFKSVVADRSLPFLLLSILFLILYFVNPDNFMSGTLTQRVGFFFFVFLAMWLPFQRIPLPISLILAGVIIFAVIYKQTLMPGFYKPQVFMINQLQELDPHLEKGSTIYTLRESDNWLHLHFGLYVGLEKDLVNLNNPQCYGPFPLIWNEDRVPVVMAGEMQVGLPGLGKPERPGRREIPLEQVVIFYHDRFLQSESNSAWIKILEDNYQLVHTSSYNDAALYKIKSP